MSLALLALPSLSILAHLADPPRQTSPADAELVRPVLSLGDFDGDGWLDVYAVYEEGEDKLWRNLGDGTFEDATERAGLAGNSGSLGAAWIDFDADLRLDLYVIASRTERRLFRNVEGQTFEDATASAGLDGVADEIAARWVDFNDDGYEDLFVRTRSGDLLFHNNGRGQLEGIDLGAVERALALAPFAASDADSIGSREGAPPRHPFAPLPPVGAGGSSNLRAGSSASAGASAGSGALLPGGIATAQPVIQCEPSLIDQAGGPCIRASSVPALGKLYPLSNHLYVDAASGHVGAGTTSPVSRLHVVTGSEDVLRGTTTGATARMYLEGSSGAEISAHQVNTNKRMRISSGPAGGYVEVAGPGAGGATVIATAPGTNFADIVFKTQSGADRMVIDQDGKVGIGTTSPIAALHLVGASETALCVQSSAGTAKLQIGGPSGALIAPPPGSSVGDLALEANSTGGLGGYLHLAGMNNDLIGTGLGSVEIGAALSAPQTGDVFIRTKGEMRLMVDQDGRVGVGTESPVSTLSVAGSADVTSSLGVGTTAPMRPFHVRSDDDLARFEGTTGYLDVVNTAPSGLMLSTDGTGPLSIRTASGSGAGQVMVDTSGRVGIGTDTPSSTLSVNGNANVSTSLSVGSTLGIGTATPSAPLDIDASGPAWTTWSKAVELQDGSALKWSASGPGWRHGIVQGANGLEIIRAQVDDGSAAHSKSIVVSNDGWVGIGTTGTPTAKLQVSDGNTGNFGASSAIALTGSGDQSIAVNTIGTGSAGLFLHNGGANAWRVSADRDTDDFVIANDSAGLAWQGPAFVTVKDNGDVGIGTSTPLAKLDVGGTTRTQCVTITGGCDIVEGFETGGEVCEPGTVLVIDARRPGELCASSSAYDKKVAGVVSGAGGVRPGLALAQEGTLDGETKVAMAGRVYVLCTAENGAIEPGDRLTTASLAGHAMKATDPERCDGAVLGKAMSPLAEGTGLVLVLVNLQ